MINNCMAYYIIYKVTNKINGKIYIGCHKTEDLNDGYMGSGKYLTHSINKHGIENFDKEILFVYDNPDEMYAKEAEIVNEDFLAEENTYNLKLGGSGGWDHIKNNEGTRTHLRLMKEDPEYRSRTRKAISNGAKKRYQEKPSHWIGREHTPETKKKIGTKSKIHQKGKGNSQYGTCWIRNPKLGNKKISKSELPSYLEQGWVLGRKIKA